MKLENGIWTLTLALVVLNASASAQEEREGEEIETDRDSFTQSLSLAPQGRIITEAAWTFVDNKEAKETHSSPNCLFRYGLTENLEIRFGSNYEIGGEPNATSGGGGAELGERNAAGGGELEEETKISYGLKSRNHRARKHGCPKAP